MKGEYDVLVLQNQPVKADLSTHEAGDFEAERDDLKMRLSMLEKELKSAKNVAESAKKKQTVREGYLRQVIDQYKALEKEHKEVLAKLEETKTTLSIKNDRRTEQSDSEKRDITMEFDAEKVIEARRNMLSKKVRALLVNKDEEQSQTSHKSKPMSKRKGFFRLGRSSREGQAVK